MPETWPKRFLVFTIDYRGENISARSQIVTADETEYENAQDFAERWSEDHAVLRIYELRQMFGMRYQDA